MSATNMVKLAGFKGVIALSAILLLIVVFYSLRVRKSPVVASPLPAARASAEELPRLAPQEELSADCCHVAAKTHIDALCGLNESVHSNNCSCTDYMLCKLVVVTALSSNHFLESRDFFGSVLAKLPSSKVIVYDLGLTEDQVHSIESYCSVLEVRKFNFAVHPPHTRNLLTYAWKPFLVEEVSKQYELFLYCDTSCRIHENFMEHLPDLLRYPILIVVRTHHSVVRTTHDGMLKYLTPKLKREWLVNTLPNGFGATGIVFLVTDVLKERFLTPWVDCAEHRECITPAGAKLSPCLFNTKPNTAYVGCHRYDQSAMNLILLRELGQSLHKMFSETDLIKVERSNTKEFDNSESKRCKIY